VTQFWLSAAIFILLGMLALLVVGNGIPQ